MDTTRSWPCPVVAAADLGRHTTMRIGGRIQWLLEPASPAEFAGAWRAALELGAPPLVLGGGANLLIEGGEHAGVVISTDRLRRTFRPMGGAEAGQEALDEELPEGRMAPPDPAKDPRLVAWAGATLPSLVRAARDLGYSGIEGLIGVPGQLGGGIAMNAGGRWGELWDVVERVFVLEPDGSEAMLERADCNPRYRNGGLGGRVVLGAVLRFEPAPRLAIEQRMREYLLEKRRVQPVTEASCGCVFKNPDRERSEGRSAGKLIEDCGGKRLERGAAIVSPLHGNFVINRGGATAGDVWGLVEALRSLVAEKSGIELEIEVRRWIARDGRLAAFESQP